MGSFERLMDGAVIRPDPYAKIREPIQEVNTNPCVGADEENVHELWSEYDNLFFSKEVIEQNIDNGVFTVEEYVDAFVLTKKKKLT